jgi:signal peptidase I
LRVFLLCFITFKGETFKGEHSNIICCCLNLGRLKIKNMLKILKYFTFFFLVFGLGIIIAIIISTSLPAKIWNRLDASDFSKLTSRIPRFYIVQSGSMKPAIKTGSIVVSLPSDNYFQGDVITFSPRDKSNNLITHRVVFKKYTEESSPTYLTAGDANEDLDSWEITNANIIGKNVLTLPYLGYLANFAKTPQGFLILVIVPATIVIYEEIKNLLRELFLFIKNTKSKFSFKGETFKAGKKKSDSGSLPWVAAIFPILGAGMVLVGLTAAYFNDIEESIGNAFKASGNFQDELQVNNPPIQDLYEDEPTATPSPTLVPDDQVLPIATQEGEFIKN